MLVGFFFFLSRYSRSCFFFFFSSRRRHTRWNCDWSSDVCSSDLALAGGVALAVLMIPMIARTTEEMVRLVPHSLREAALALGYPRWRTSLRIVARTALAGIV